MKHDQYILLCAKIKLVFPEEVNSIYYVPYISKGSSPDGKCVFAKGRLVDKVRNILYRSGDTLPHKKKKRELSDFEQNPSTSYEVDGIVLFYLFSIKTLIVLFQASYKNP